MTALIAAIAVLASGPAPTFGPDPAPALVEQPWRDLARCEAGLGDRIRWDYRGLHHGGLQFSPATWQAFAPDGFPEEAWQASPAQQVAVAERVQRAQGWGAWPVCSREIGLR